MTTYTIATPTNITALAAKAGADVYNVTTGTLTLDSDSRYGPGTSPATGPMGSITGSATLTGAIQISGTNVRLIPYSGGAGNVPASGTLITRGAAQAELLCVMAARTGGAVTPAASPMPATGWLKVRNVTAAFTVGAMAGITATASAPDETGWIELVGVQGSNLTPTHTCPLTVTAAWFTVGTTTGVAGQTLQLPAFDATTEYPGVEVEDTPGGTYSFWPNAGTGFTSVNLGTDSRSRMVSITSAGVLSFGMGRDALPAGLVPPTGCKVRIPNIITSSAAVGALGVNVAPAAAMATRYKLNCPGAAVTVSGITGSWFLNLAQPLSATLANVHTCDQLALSAPAKAPSLTNVHVGLSNQPAPLALVALSMSRCFEGGTITGASALRADQPNTGAYAAVMSDYDGAWAINKLRCAFAADSVAVAGALYLANCETVNINNLETVGKRVLAVNCGNLAINGLTYADSVKQATPTTAACSALELLNCRTVKVSGITNWPGVTNTHPYNALVYINNTRDSLICANGSAASPYNAGTVNAMGYLVIDGANNLRGAWQRNWATALRVGLFSSSTSSRRVQADNNSSTNATLSAAINFCDALSRGNRHNGGAVPAVATGVYGTCFRDAFTSDTTAHATIVFVEKSSLTPTAYAVLGSPQFSGGGSLVMATVGDQVAWTWPYAILGWSGLTSAVVAGTNTGNHTIEYDLDKGAGFSGVWKTLSTLNLTAETGISPTLGVRPRVRITTGTAAATNLLTALAITGTTTLALQNAALYPLATAVTPLLPVPSLPVIDPGTTPGAGSGGGGATTLTALDVAAAVWAFANGNGATAEVNLLKARAAAENAFAVSA